MPDPRPSPPHISPAGHARLSDERDVLRAERHNVVEIVSWAAGNGDRSENADYQYGKKRLREIDRRLRFLLHRLKEAEIVDPAHPVDRNIVLFGATVTYENDDGDAKKVTILGTDEAETSRREISLKSPLAIALMRKRVGDVAVVQTPTGPQEIEITSISYPAPSDQD